MPKKRVGGPPKAPKKGDEQSLLKHEFERLMQIGAQEPDGYAFVPKGDIYVTRHCREMTGAGGKVLYVVYDPQNNARLGLRCPIEIVNAVTARSEATAQTRKKAVKVNDERNLVKARELMGILYPRLPLKEMETILAHSFEKKSGRVGRTGTLPLKEKVELATVAYARHTFTDYEQRLDKMRKQKMDRVEAKETARREIREKLDEVLAGWLPEKTRWNAKFVKATTDAKTCKAPTTVRKTTTQSVSVREPSSTSSKSQIKVAQKGRRELKLQARRASNKDTKSQMKKPAKRANVSKVRKTVTKQTKTERRTSGRQAAVTAKARPHRTSQGD